MVSNKAHPLQWVGLLRRNLRHHRRGNFAVMLGIAVATAALAGALLVGDSLRGSLRERVERAFGRVHYRAMLARPITDESLQVLEKNHDLAGIMAARGEVLVKDKDGRLSRRARDVRIICTNRLDYARTNSRARQVSLIGWIKRVTRTATSSIKQIRIELKSWVSPELARELALAAVDSVVVRVHPRSAIPSETTFGRKTGVDYGNEQVARIAVLTADDDLADFNPIDGIESRRVFYWQPWQQSELASATNVLVSENAPPETSSFRRILGLADYGLALRLRADANRFQLQSDSLLLSTTVMTPALAAAESLHLHAEPTLVYLANGISDGTHEIPYSVVAALNPQAAAPLGPFLDPKEPPLADDEILLADWAESPLTAKPGDKITLRYFLPESEGKASEATATFRLRAKVPMVGPAADPFLTPEFPGITDKLTLGDWDPPFPYDAKKITKRDEDYWNKYRGTPKAYVNWAVGQKLFASRFGVATSVRIAPKSPETIEADAKAFEAALKERLNPADFGFVFRNVREEALKAAEGSVDFGGLFLGFSTFLIVAALMLVALLVRLNLDRRASEVGLWLSLGFTQRTVRRLLLAEGLILSAIGAFLGLILAVGHAGLMLRVLANLWPEGHVGSFLGLHVTGTSLATGFFAAVVLSAITIGLAFRGLARIPAPALLRGVSAPDLTARGASQGETNHDPGLRFGLANSILTAIAAAAIIAGFLLRDPEARAGAFFAGGAALLILGLVVFRRWLHGRDTAGLSVARLGIRNAARNPTRSLLTAGLIASAAFLLVAVESFRRSPDKDFASNHGGSGGYSLIASLDVPLYQDPEDPAGGRQEILDALEKQYQRGDDSAGKLAKAKSLLEASRLIPMRVKAGDEAGCRNLAKPTTPRLFGVPNRFIERGGFHFAATIEKSANPWQLLLKRDDAIPVFGEANTVTWMLHKSLGDTIEITDGQGQPVKLRIVGLLKDSIFQGELVMAEPRLLELDPSTEGYPTLLAAGPAEELRTILETAYAERGVTVERSADRLRSYLAIENTYLSTFQILGGFGLLLGACGLGVVLMRSAWERRGELALLQSVGFRRRDLRRMVLSENLLLLGAGLAIGVVAALAAVAPQLILGEASAIPWLRLVALLSGVAVVGLFAARVALRSPLRAPIVAALRGE